MDLSENSCLNYFYIRRDLCNPWLNPSVVLRNLSLFMPLAPTTRARLQATLACGGACVLFTWRGGLGPTIVFGVTVVFALMAWITPRVYAPVQRSLDRAVHLVLTAFTWLLLGLLYLLVFTPLRIGRTFFGRDPLQRRIDPAAATYLSPIPPAAVNRFDRQF